MLILSFDDPDPEQRSAEANKVSLRALSKHGFRGFGPKPIASGSGLILEEEIPLRVSVALRSASAEKVLAQLLNIAAAIARLGFLPVSGSADIRSRGDDAVYVEFGSDLGLPNRLASSSDMIFKQFHEQFETWRYPLTLEQAGGFREKFLARLGSSVQRIMMERATK